MFIVIIKLVLLAVPQARENVEVRCTFAFLPRSSQDRAPQAGLSSRGGRGCEGGPAAAKIRCLLGRSRLGRKRGRLFLRLGRRSQDERLAWRS
jgi:hypothetical protein